MWYCTVFITLNIYDNMKPFVKRKMLAAYSTSVVVEYHCSYSTPVLSPSSIRPWKSLYHKII